MSTTDDPDDITVECARCHTPIHPVCDDHYQHTWKDYPVPEKEDMEFDDWFSKGAYLCVSCHNAFGEFMTSSSGGKRK